MNSVLIVEDERYEREQIKNTLQHLTYQIFTASSTSEALNILHKNEVDVVLLDIQLKGCISGIDFIDTILDAVPYVQIIMITANNSMETIVKAIKSGAFFYMIKPIDEGKLPILIESAVKHGKIKKENLLTNAYLEKSHANSKHTIIGGSPAIIDLKDKLKKISKGTNDICVLLTGESGTGKEVFARHLNALNITDVNSRKFIDVNCASISKELFESEFFGHEKGAFTNADKRKTGFFEMADGGDIFLDEIGNLPLEFQAKLLRILQEKKIRYVGGTKDVSVDFRLISATNADLKKMVREGSFRKDLYYRIKVVELHLPPLRERKEDIPQLVEYFLKSISRKMKKDFQPLSSKMLNVLMKHDWPGNIRELKNTLENLVVLGFNGTHYSSEVLTDSIRQNRIDNDLHTFKFNENSTMIDRFINDPDVVRILDDSIHQKRLDLNRLRELFEKSIIQTALEDCDNNLSSTAKMLGMARTTLHYRLKSMEIN